jgi:hypothetical protein
MLCGGRCIVCADGNGNAVRVASSRTPQLSLKSLFKFLAPSSGTGGFRVTCGPRNLIATSFFDTHFTPLFSTRKPVNEMDVNSFSSLFSARPCPLRPQEYQYYLKVLKMVGPCGKSSWEFWDGTQKKIFVQIVVSWDGIPCDSVYVFTVNMEAECNFSNGNNCILFECVHQYHCIKHRHIHSSIIRYMAKRVVI